MSSVVLLLLGMFLQDILSFVMARFILKWMNRNERGSTYDVSKTRWFRLFPRAARKRLNSKKHRVKALLIRMVVNSPVLDAILLIITKERKK